MTVVPALCMQESTGILVQMERDEERHHPNKWGPQVSSSLSYCMYCSIWVNDMRSRRGLHVGQAGAIFRSSTCRACDERQQVVGAKLRLGRAGRPGRAASYMALSEINACAQPQPSALHKHKQLGLSEWQ